MPHCPVCNAPMVLRTARRGPRAGRQFYGCCRYPECRGILDYGGNPSDGPIDPAEQHLSPRYPAAKSKYKGYKVSFFESVATSSACLEAIRLSGLADSDLRSFAQWRLDFPSAARSGEWTERTRQMFSVCEKILTRGRITLCSPDLESEISDMFDIGGDSEGEVDFAEIINEIRVGSAHGQQERAAGKLAQFVHALKISHQVQVTILQAARYGFLNFAQPHQWNIVFQYSREGALEREEAGKVFRPAAEDLAELIYKLGDLYSVQLPPGKPFVTFAGDGDPPPGGALCISFSNQPEDGLPTFCIQDIHLPHHIAISATPAAAAVLDVPRDETLLYFLKYLFRKDSFWEGQLDAVLRAFQGRDAILLLPTGGGKSIAFQLASLLLPGISVVIEPIISLIEDQLDNLAAYGIDRCIGISSQSAGGERTEALNLFGQAEYLIAYIAPERLQITEFRDSLRSLTVHTPVNMVVIDEAHCVSEWGHDFRTAYLNIGRISREYCSSRGAVLPLIALTGTASRAVLKDVRRELGIVDFDAIITPKTFDRPELEFEVIHCSSTEKFPRLKGYLGQLLPDLFRVPRGTLFQARGRDTYSGLVFCPWVNGSLAWPMCLEK